jgi:S-DNA-T family DNA segregation ATPase FtsK/SpoIIIE
MSERRAWRLDLAAGILLCAGLLVALAVFSFDPADLPGSVYPPQPAPRNLLGAPGAALAGELVGALGAAVYVWLAAWFVFVVLLVLRKNWLAWSLRLCGWLLLVPTAAVLAQRWGPPDAAAGPAGVGGAVGAWLDQRLSSLAGPLLQHAVLAAAALLGLSLAGHFALRRTPAAARLLLWLFRGLFAFGRGAARRATRGTWAVLRFAFRCLAAVWRRLPRLRLPRLRLPARRRPVPPPPALPPAGVAAPVPKPPADGVFALTPQTIPILHHGVNPLPPAPADADAPRLQERAAAGLSNGLQSERQRFADYELPPLDLLEDPRPVSHADQEQHLREQALLLEKTVRDFGLNVKVVGINTGPVVTMYEVALETGLRVHKVTALADDLALHLKVPSVRMVAPIPGKNAVGIEIPNEHRADVRLKEVIQTSLPRIARARVPLFLGKDAEGRPLMFDLTDMPHLLIAGTTGTGKSVSLNAMILSLLMTRRPDEVRLVLIDPKRVEMECYSKVPHLMSPIIEDMKKAEAVLAWAVDKMEERYDLLRRARVRNIASYNELTPAEILRRVAPVDDDERQRTPERMSYIVIVIDEMSDLMMQFKKEVEGYIIRLAQKSRAAGIHLILATQKPTVDVITGLIKSNLPSRICFKVAQKSDSRVVLDQMGADKLLSKGDMLFLPPGTSNLVRAQGAFASDAEILKVADYLESDPCYDAELLQLKTKEVREAEEEGGSLRERLKARDALYHQAVEVVVREGRGSVSLLQRALGIGYGRASRLIDFMAEDGIVGTYNGSNAREVLYTPEQWSAFRDAGDEPAA